jgi:hypothetical protein
MLRLPSLPLPALLLAALSPACGDDVGAHDFSSDVEHCNANLRAIYRGLVDYELEHGAAPETSGVAFFATLIAGGTWENTEENARTLTCPGVPTENLSIAGKPPKEWYASLEGLDGSASAYAGRDQANHPLASFPGPGTEALVACDNHGGANHETVTNVLLADGSVLSLELEREKEAGNVPEDAEVLVVGQESPLEELRTLSLE